MINFSKSQSLNSRLILSFYLFICCSQTLVYANIGCQFQFLKGKSLLISVAGPQDEKERSILAALQVENENSCAEFCCDFDLVDKSKTRCGAAVFTAESTRNFESEEGSSGHNCFLFNCNLPEGGQDCTKFHNGTDVVTTILVDPRNDLPPIDPNAARAHDRGTGRGQSRVGSSQAMVPVGTGYSTSETTSTTNALLVTLLILFSCIALVGGVVMSNYLYQQYQKRKLYYKLDKMDGNGDFFSSEDKYNYNE